MNHQSVTEFKPQLQQIWDAMARQDLMPPQADAIVIGGCRDYGLAERAAELYHLGISKYIVISGYQPEYLDSTEASLLAGRCIELGVPNDAIRKEKAASNTGENILFSAEIIQRELKEVSSVILIHKPYMTLRFLATAEAQWPAPQPKFYTTCQSISLEDYAAEKGLEAVGWEMLGDFNRMDEYVTKGFQTQKQIPNSARDAYERIVSTGFTTR